MLVLLTQVNRDGSTSPVYVHSESVREVDDRDGSPGQTVVVYDCCGERRGITVLGTADVIAALLNAGSGGGGTGGRPELERIDTPVFADPNWAPDAGSPTQPLLFAEQTNGITEVAGTVVAQIVDGTLGAQLTMPDLPGAPSSTANAGAVIVRPLTPAADRVIFSPDGTNAFRFVYNGDPGAGPNEQVVFGFVAQYESVPIQP